MTSLSARESKTNQSQSVGDSNFLLTNLLGEAHLANDVDWFDLEVFKISGINVYRCYFLIRKNLDVPTVHLSTLLYIPSNSLSKLR